jgi:hypothetical protein
MRASPNARSSAHAPSELPGPASLVRQWKRWEAGEKQPSDFCKPIIAATFGTVTRAMLPVSLRSDASDVLAMAGMDTLELVSRLQRSDLDQATLDGLRIMADRLCSEYPFMPAGQLLLEGRAWLRRITALQGQRVTLRQHCEILVFAGWVALLVGCVEYDTGNRHAAETTRQAALSLGMEADHGEIIAWAHEMRAWINLTPGDYHGVIAAGLHAGRLARRSLPFGAAARTAGSHRGRCGFDKGTLAAAHIGLLRAGEKPARFENQRTGRRPLSNPPLRPRVAARAAVTYTCIAA